MWKEIFIPTTFALQILCQGYIIIYATTGNHAMFFNKFWSEDWRSNVKSKTKPVSIHFINTRLQKPWKMPNMLELKADLQIFKKIFKFTSLNEVTILHAVNFFSTEENTATVCINSELDVSVSWDVLWFWGRFSSNSNQLSDWVRWKLIEKCLYDLVKLSLLLMLSENVWNYKIDTKMSYLPVEH